MKRPTLLDTPLGGLSIPGCFVLNLPSRLALATNILCSPKTFETPSEPNQLPLTVAVMIGAVVAPTPVAIAQPPNEYEQEECGYNADGNTYDALLAELSLTEAGLNGSPIATDRLTIVPVLPMGTSGSSPSHPFVVSVRRWI